MDEEFPFIRGQLLDNLSVTEYHKRTLDMIEILDEQIDELTEEINVPGARQWKNPRQEAEYLHNVKTLSIIKRQKERLVEKLNQLQDRIQEDIEISKKITSLKKFEVSPKDILNENGVLKK